MANYANNSGNSPITNYIIGSDYIVVTFKVNKNYTYSYNGNGGAGQHHVDIMKNLATVGTGLSAYITKNVKNLFDK